MEKPDTLCVEITKKDSRAIIFKTKEGQIKQEKSEKKTGDSKMELKNTKKKQMTRHKTNSWLTEDISDDQKQKNVDKIIIYVIQNRCKN